MTKVPLGSRQLRYFIAIVDAGALSRAAANLSIAQSALSHHVSELEAQLGMPLLERRARGVVPTAEGRRLYQHAKAIVAALAKAEADVKNFSEAPSGNITVGITHSAVEMVTLPFLKRVKRDFDLVQLRLYEGLSSAVTGRVIEGEADLALVYNPHFDSRFEVLPVLVEDMYLVGKPEIIGSSQRPINLSSINHRPILAPLPQANVRSMIEHQLMRTKVLPADWLEVDSLTALRQIAAGGLGCTILAKSGITDLLREGIVNARRIVRPPLTRSVKILSLADRPKTKAFIEVRNALVEVCREEVLSGRWDARLLPGTDTASPRT